MAIVRLKEKEKEKYENTVCFKFHRALQEVLKQAKWETSAPGTSTMNSQVLNYVIVSTKLHETGREGGNDMLFRLGVFILRCV